MKESPIDRREFIKRTAATGIGVTLAGGLIAGCKDSPTNSSSSKTITIDISKPENAALTTINGGMKITVDGIEKPVMVTRVSQTEVAAFSSECTHKGCVVDPPSSSGEVICPCHGAKFSITGLNIKGPAQSDLEKYTATLSGNIITINT